jgi:hypothetical protein
MVRKSGKTISVCQSSEQLKFQIFGLALDFKLEALSFPSRSSSFSILSVKKSLTTDL